MTNYIDEGYSSANIDKNLKGKKFVTIFPQLENIHLIKDVGMIPYILHKFYGYDSEIVSFKNGDYPYINSYTKGLKHHYLAGIKYKKYCSSLFLLGYILWFAHEIDILNLYHLRLANLLAMKLYKMINQSGICFLKLDSDYIQIDGDFKMGNPLTGRRFGRTRWKIKKKLCKKIDIISAESDAACKVARKILEREVIFIPNGFYNFGSQDTIDFEKKENIFLTVGRLGTLQKNTDYLLEAFVKIYQKCNWNLMLVGSMEIKTREKLDKLSSQYEDLRERIIYVEEVTDRAVLCSYYSKAKVFLLPSRWESFALAAAEAQSRGCYLILSDKVASWKELTDDKRLGAVVGIDDSDALANIMLKVACEEHDYQKQVSYAKEHFYWPSIGENINRILNDFNKNKVTGESGIEKS